MDKRVYSYESHDIEAINNDNIDGKKMRSFAAKRLFDVIEFIEKENESNNIQFESPTSSQEMVPLTKKHHERPKSKKTLSLSEIQVFLNEIANKVHSLNDEYQSLPHVLPNF